MFERRLLFFPLLTGRGFDSLFFFRTCSHPLDCSGSSHWVCWLQLWSFLAVLTPVFYFSSRDLIYADLASGALARRELAQREIDVLPSKMAIFASSITPRPTRFVFDSNVHLMRAFTSFGTVSWVSRVNLTDTASVDKTASEVRDAYNKTCQILPGLTANVSYPVTFISESDANWAAICFNIDSEAKRHYAIQQALATGLPVATKVISLVQGGLGVLVVSPVPQTSTAMSRMSRNGILTFIVRPELVLAAGALNNCSSVALFSREDNTTRLLRWTGENSSLTPPFQTQAELQSRDLIVVCNDLRIVSGIWVLCEVMHPDITDQLPFTPLGLFLVMLLCVYIILQLLLVVAFCTHQKHSEKKAAADALQAAKDAAFLNLGHELRTPLLSINLAIEELRYASKGEAVDSDAKQHESLLNTISVSAETLLGLINDMLDLGQITAGKMHLHPAWFDVHELLEEVSQLLRPIAEKRGALIVIDEKLSMAAVMLDRNRVRQILVNLMSNAIKYSTGNVGGFCKDHRLV